MEGLRICPPSSNNALSGRTRSQSDVVSSGTFEKETREDEPGLFRVLTIAADEEHQDREAHHSSS